MKIKFLEKVQVEIVESIDEHDNTESSQETFEKDFVLELDKIDDDVKSDFIQFQFGNGDVTFINKNCFIEVQ